MRIGIVAGISLLAGVLLAGCSTNPGPPPPSGGTANSSVIVLTHFAVPSQDFSVTFPEVPGVTTVVSGSDPCKTGCPFGDTTGSTYQATVLTTNAGQVCLNGGSGTLACQPGYFFEVDVYKAPAQAVLTAGNLETVTGYHCDAGIRIVRLTAGTGYACQQFYRPSMNTVFVMRPGWLYLLHPVSDQSGGADFTLPFLDSLSPVN